MSLLLEALKKAELAKQNAQAEQAPEPRDEEATVTLRLEERREPVITRESLPNISDPVDIKAEDLGSVPGLTPRAEPLSIPFTPAEPPPPAAREPYAAPPAPAESAAPARDAARQLFEVKEVDYNPRRPFYITVGVLIAAGVGYGAYVWWQMQPRYAVSAAAVKAAPVAAVPAPPPPPAPAPTGAAAPAVPASPLPTGAAALPTQGSAAPGPVAAASRTAPPPAAAVARPGGPPASPSAARAVTAPATPAQAPITITPPSLQFDETLEQGYAAYQRGELDASREAYQKVLAREPNSRDALLGLAALDVRLRRFDTAELRYLRLLELDPRDAHAHAGLIALRGASDPLQSESRLKSLIANQPDAVHLYFPLGNQYAAQGRWNEAQEAYFKAYSADPDNPDFAYNLAVSLDHLRQSRLALDYYLKAIGLAAGRPASFDRARAELRAKELGR